VELFLPFVVYSASGRVGCLTGTHLLAPNVATRSGRLPDRRGHESDDGQLMFYNLTNGRQTMGLVHAWVTRVSKLTVWVNGVLFMETGRRQGHVLWATAFKALLYWNTI
jgi:hypothetical protein